MTTIALHQTPDGAVVLRQQLRAVGSSMRRAGLVLLGLAVVLFIATLVAALQAAAHSNRPQGFEFDPAMMLPVFLLGLVAAVGTWQREEPSRRGYHLAMPAPAVEHTATRVFAGWVWCMAAVAGSWVVLWALGGTVAMIGKGEFRMGLTTWLFLAPFAAASMTYLLASIILIASERPGMWIVSLPTGVAILFSLPDAYHATAGIRLVHRILDSPFSPVIPMWPVFRTISADHHGWIVNWQRGVAGTAAWIAIGLIGVWLAARKRPRATK